MQLIQQNENSSGLRRFIFRCTENSFNGLQSGVAALSGEIFLTKNGNTFISGQPNSFVEVNPAGLAVYFYQLSQSDTDTLGLIEFSFDQAGLNYVQKEAMVVAFNPYSSSGISANSTHWAGTPIPTPTIPGYPQVDLLYVGSSGVVASGIPEVNVTQWDSVRVATPDITGLPKVTISLGSGVGQLNISSSGSNSIAQSVWDVVRSTHNTVGTFGEMNQVSGVGGTATVTGTVNANVIQWSSVNVATPDYTGYPKVSLFVGTGNGQFNPNATGTNSIAQSVWDVSLSAHSTASTFGLANQPSYQAAVEYNLDDTNSRDEYVVIFYKNGMPVATDSGAATIQVVARTDGTDVVASTSLTKTTGLESYYLNTSSRLAAGESATVIVSATIDGATRTFYWPISRDV